MVVISLSATASGKRVHISISVRMYLYPSDGGLSGSIISTQTVENGVPTRGNLPIGALPTVPFDTFLWHRSHDATYRVTKLCIPGHKILVALYSMS